MYNREKKVSSPVGREFEIGFVAYDVRSVVPPRKGIKCVLTKGQKNKKKGSKNYFKFWVESEHRGGASLNMEQTSGHMVDKQVHSAAEEQLVVMLSLMLLAAEDSAAAAEAAMRFAAVAS